MLNHYTSLNESSTITIEFLSGTWKIYGANAMFGFTQPQSLNYLIQGNKITLSTDVYKRQDYALRHYSILDSKLRA